MPLVSVMPARPRFVAPVPVAVIAVGVVEAAVAWVAAVLLSVLQLVSTARSRQVPEPACGAGETKTRPEARTPALYWRLDLRRTRTSLAGTGSVPWSSRSRAGRVGRWRRIGSWRPTIGEAGANERRRNEGQDAKKKDVEDGCKDALTSCKRRPGARCAGRRSVRSRTRDRRKAGQRTSRGAEGSVTTRSAVVDTAVLKERILKAARALPRVVGKGPGDVSSIAAQANL